MSKAEYPHPTSRPHVAYLRRRAYIHHLLTTHEMLAEVLLMMYVRIYLTFVVISAYGNNLIN